MLIGFLLWHRRTRPYAIPCMLFFHGLNNWMFNIGIFPVVMIAATVLFFEAHTPKLWWTWIRKSTTPLTIEPTRATQGAFHLLGLAFTCTYLLLQLLIPLRHWLYAGNVSWTEEGHNFSWHMKLRTKQGHIHFVINLPEGGPDVKMRKSDHLDRHQILKMSTRPHMIVQYAHFLRDELRKRGFSNPVIRVYSSVSLNHRPSQPI